MATESEYGRLTSLGRLAVAAPALASAGTMLTAIEHPRASQARAAARLTEELLSALVDEAVELDGEREQRSAREPLTLEDCTDGIARQRAIHRPSGTEGIVCGYIYGEMPSTGSPEGHHLVTILLDQARSSLEAPLADFDRAD